MESSLQLQPDHKKYSMRIRVSRGAIEGMVQVQFNSFSARHFAAQLQEAAHHAVSTTCRCLCHA